MTSDLADRPLEFFNTKHPVFVMLVGLPYSGKSTWAKAQTLPVVDTDSYIEKLAAEAGVEYNDVFKELYPDAETKMMCRALNFVASRRSFIWDQTNLTLKSRAKKLKIVNEQKFFKIAVHFETNQTSARRVARKKFVPDYAMEAMTNYHTAPTLDEGFDLVIFKRT